MRFIARLLCPFLARNVSFGGKLASVAVLLVSTLLTVVNAQGPQPTASLRRDEAALAAIDHAIGAMGGSTVWASINDATVMGVCSLPGVDSSDTPKSEPFRWVTAGSQFRYETSVYGFPGLLLSGNGTPMLLSASASTGLSAEYKERLLPLHLPGIELQKDLSTKSISVVLLAEEKISETMAIHIRTIEHVGPVRLQGSSREWWFDPNTSLPLRVSFALPAPDNSEYQLLSWDFSSWGFEGTVNVAHQLTESLEHQITMQSCTVERVTFNTKPNVAEFEGR